MLNKEHLDNLTDQIWKSAVKLRGNFKAYEYQNVVLPMIVIRRLECVLIKERERIAEGIKAKQPSITDEALAKMVKSLEPSMLTFHNKTEWTLRSIIEEDSTKVESHFREYLNGFSENIQEIIDKFNYRSTVGQMVSKGQLHSIIKQYSKEELGPDKLSNLEMGYVYEELIRKFSEQSGEEAGEHFTPREVIRLMVELLEISVGKQRISIYDPACGTGGMLSVAKEHLLDKAANDKEREQLDSLVTLYGQELQQSNFAICKADMLIKGDKNTHIHWGNSLVPDQQGERIPGDQHASESFDYMLSNPPFGVSWSEYKSRVEKYQTTRYKAGLPPSNNGAFLFLQSMIDKMKPADKGGSKIAIIFNGSPLSNGDCMSGESEIRRWIMEKDLLDTIVMLPDQLFYNTGIFTYIWLLSNAKSAKKKDQVLIIDARAQYEKEPKSFGSKRNRQVDEHRAWIEDNYRNWEANEFCKIFKTKDFAYHKVKVVFWQTDENDQQAYITEPFDRALTNPNVKKDLELYGDLDFDLSVTFPSGTIGKIAFTLKPDKAFVATFEDAIVKAYPKEFTGLSGRDLKAFIKGLPVEAEYTHRHYVVDYEYIPYGEDVDAFLNREIGKQIIMWEDSEQLGYEILPNKYFYRYQPPTPAKELLAEFWRLEKEAEGLLAGLTGEDSTP